MLTQSDNSFTYLPVPEIVTRLGLYVTGAGTDYVPPGAAYPRQVHPELYDFTWRAGRILPDFQFVFIAEGQGEFESRESGVLPVEAGTVMMLFPDVWHRYRPIEGTGWSEYWVSLGGDLLFRWHERGLFSANQPLKKLDNPDIATDEYQELVDLAMQSPDVSAIRLTAAAMTVVARALDSKQLHNQSSEDSVDDAVRQALHIIWNHSHEQISIDMITKQIGVNRRTLERRFKNQLGKTILQELVQCRLQRAKRLLRETHVPIKYVAYAAGFSSLSNLCKVFRREVGVTPGDYRERVSTR